MPPDRQLFWGCIVDPGSSVSLDCPDGYYMIITGVSLGELSDSRPGNSTLKATIQTVHLDKVDPNSSTDPIETSEAILAVLSVPLHEHEKLSRLFSPLNQVALTVGGTICVHVSGFYSPIPTDEEEDFSEEEDTHSWKEVNEH
jgi:hypothetical protein